MTKSERVKLYILKKYNTELVKQRITIGSTIKL